MEIKMCMEKRTLKQVKKKSCNKKKKLKRFHALPTPTQALTMLALSANLCK